MRTGGIWRERCWAVIDLDVIEQNTASLLARLPAGCALMAIVKGEGYGHGILPAAAACVKAGAQWLGVAALEEAAALREGGLTCPILILGVTPPALAPALLRYRLSQTVPSLDYARELASRLGGEEQGLPIHLGVDTGMGRLGWWTEPETVPAVCRDIREICRIGGLQVQGIMTHLSSARGTDQEAAAYTRRQLESFRLLCRTLEAQGIHIPLKHAANSGALLRHSDSMEGLNLVRVGHLLYDALPGGEALGLRPALELKASVAYVKELPAGACVGYGRTFRLPEPARIAVVNIGSCDGYPSCLSNKGRMLLRGTPVPVVGSVCMDQTMLDVSAVPAARAGDTVTIVGRDGGAELTAEDVSAQAGGAMDALSTYFKNRLPRFYRRGGRLIGKLQTIQNFVSFDAESEGLSQI